MPSLKGISGATAIRTLEKLGFKQIRQHGSHVILKRETTEGKVGCVVSLHRELAEGTIRGILRQAQVTVEEFLTNL